MGVKGAPASCQGAITIQRLNALVRNTHNNAPFTASSTTHGPSGEFSPIGKKHPRRPARLRLEGEKLHATSQIQNESKSRNRAPACVGIRKIAPFSSRAPASYIFRRI
jgi:hypothetical protein